MYFTIEFHANIYVHNAGTTANLFSYIFNKYLNQYWDSSGQTVCLPDMKYGHLHRLVDQIHTLYSQFGVFYRKV